MKTKKEAILENLRKIKGIGDFEIIAQTEKKALVKSRLTGVATPSNLKTITKVTLATISLGNDYEKSVNEMLKKEGKEASFERKEGSYCLPLSAIEVGLMGIVEKLLHKLGISRKDRLSKVIYKHKEKDQFYVRVYPNLATDYTSYSIYFDISGNEIKPQEFEVFEKEYLAIKKENTNQGLDESIEVRNYKLENIIYLGDRDNVFINELDEELLNKLS